jgi:hypothetical protein
MKVKVTLRLTVSQSLSLGVEPHIYYSSTVTVLFLWGALSDERTGLSFIYAAGPRQHSFSRVRVPWDSWTYFTVSDLRLPFSSPPTTRRVTVEVFDPASTRVTHQTPNITRVALYSLRADRTENISRGSYCCVSTNCRRDMFTSALRNNGRGADLIENSVSIEVCLPNRCLATLSANQLQ